VAAFDRYLDNESGFDVLVQTGNVFQPRYMCDDDNQGVYETKAPVAILLMDPIVQFVNTNISWDVSESDTSTGTRDLFDLSFGGGGGQ